MSQSTGDAKTLLEQVDTLRQEGNTLYKSSNFLQAIQKYLQAARLLPESITPLSNLSAAYFQVGEYEACIEIARKTLALLQKSDGGDPGLEEKLNQRIMNAELYLSTRLRIIGNLPRYRSTLQTSYEYFPIGTDAVSCIFDPDIHKQGIDETTTSFLFGGIGDARHLLRTVIGIAYYERQDEIEERRYHATIIDINKCAIARDLVIFLLLEELSTCRTGSSEAEEVLNTLFFVYSVPMVPLAAFKHLQRIIDQALSTLQSGRQPLEWLHLRKVDFDSYIRVLRSWKSEALLLLTNKQIINAATKLLPISKQPMPQTVGDEFKLYQHTAAVLPSEEYLKKNDPDILIHRNSEEPMINVQHPKKHWKFNVTLMDVDWYNSLIDKSGFYFGSNPFTTRDIHSTTFNNPSTQPRLYDFFAPFFINAAKSIKQLKGRLLVEGITGDYVDVAEKIRFNLYRDDSSTTELAVEGVTGVVRPKDFPVRYDRIHLSNVPDYTGGHLSTFLYASPLLKNLPSSSVQSNCLRNPTMFDSMEGFLAEYQSIPDERMLQQLTSVTILSRAGFPYRYTHYGISKSLSRSFDNILPQQSFMKWFYALFFRLALPYNQDVSNFLTIIHSPLTLTIVFRLISHLRVIGYPSHWLSEALFNILNNTVRTTTRPPRQSPNPIADVQHNYDKKHLCTAPFAEEMKTLAKIFASLLPFALPPPFSSDFGDISKYTLLFPNIPITKKISAPSCHLALVFWDPDLFRGCGLQLDSGILRKYDWVGRRVPASLRWVLDPSWGDEVNGHYRGSAIEKFREKGIIVWSTFVFDVGRMEASVWMSDKSVERIKLDWACGLWNVDEWKPITNAPVAVKNIIKKGRKWDGQ